MWTSTKNKNKKKVEKINETSKKVLYEVKKMNEGSYPNQIIFFIFEKKNKASIDWNKINFT